jgi:CRISPR-associated protein Csm5
MKVSLNTITPVHIGTTRTETLSSVDYVYKDGKIVLIDHNKLERVLDERSQGEIDLRENFIEALKQGRDKKIDDFLKDAGISLDEIELMRLPAYGEVRGEIKRMVNSNGRVYIPGSSIKGLFRTALAYSFLKNNFGLLESSVQDIIRQSAKPKDAFKSLNEKIFLNPHKDPMKNIVASDTDFFSPEDVGIFSTTRIYIKDLRPGPPSPVEAILRGKRTSFSLKIEPFKVFKKEFLFLEDPSGWKILFNKVDEFTRDLLEREIRELSRSPGFDYVSKIYKEFLHQLSMQDNSCIGRIGFGKTFFDETVTLLLEKSNKSELLEKFEGYMNNSFWGKRRRSLARNDPLPSSRLFTVDRNRKPTGALGWIKLIPQS